MRLPLVVRRRPALLLPALAAAALLVAGCRREAERAPDRRGETVATDLSGSRIEIVQSGGIAGQRTTAIVDGATMTYALITSRGCEGAACTDTVRGALPERDVRAIFGTVAEQWEAMIDDYGRSEGAADLFAYEIAIAHAGRSRRLTADDLTLPPDLRMLRDRVFQAIDSARGR